MLGDDAELRDDPLQGHPFDSEDVQAMTVVLTRLNWDEAAVADLAKLTVHLREITRVPEPDVLSDGFCTPIV